MAHGTLSVDVIVPIISLILPSMAYIQRKLGSRAAPGVVAAASSIAFAIRISGHPPPYTTRESLTV